MIKATTQDDPQAPLAYMRKQIKLVEVLAENKLTYAVTHQDYERLIHFADQLLALCQRVDAHLQELAPNPPLACHKGCGLCCRSHIELNPLFAFYVYSYLKQTRTDAQWREIREKMATEERCCPLLVSEICSIYPARPPVCRAWYSEDLDLCKVRDFCAPQAHYDPQNAYAAQHYMVFLYVLEKRLQEAEKKLGLDSRDVYLKTMLHRLDDNPELAHLWLKKEEIPVS